MSPTNSIPGTLRSSDASGSAIRKCRGPTNADVAMMDSSQYKAYAQSRGEWPEREARDFSPESSGLFSFRDEDKKRWPF